MSRSILPPLKYMDSPTMPDNPQPWKPSNLGTSHSFRTPPVLSHGHGRVLPEELENNNNLSNLPLVLILQSAHLGGTEAWVLFCHQVKIVHQQANVAKTLMVFFHISMNGTRVPLALLLVKSLWNTSLIGSKILLFNNVNFKHIGTYHFQS